MQADFNFQQQTVTISKTFHRSKGRDIITSPKTKKNLHLLCGKYRFFSLGGTLYQAKEGKKAKGIVRQGIAGGVCVWLPAIVAGSADILEASGLAR